MQDTVREFLARRAVGELRAFTEETFRLGLELHEPGAGVCRCTTDPDGQAPTEACRSFSAALPAASQLRSRCPQGFNVISQVVDIAPGRSLLVAAQGFLLEGDPEGPRPRGAVPRQTAAQGAGRAGQHAARRRAVLLSPRGPQHLRGRGLGPVVTLPSGMEALAFVTGVLAVWLTTREIVWCWPVGLVNVALYAVVFGRAQLYASMSLQLVYFALGLYGWWAWRHGGASGAPLAVARAPRRVLGALAVLGALSAIAFGTWLARATDAQLPYWDAGTAAFSLVAQALQTRKWIETWVVWIAVDVVFVGMYAVQGLVVTALLYATFLGIAVAGLVRWRRVLGAPLTARESPCA